MILLVDAGGRPLSASWTNADGSRTRVVAGEAHTEASAYEVEIRDVATGVTGRHTTTLPWGEGSEYFWTDGNMGCDCNRALLFWRAQHPGAALEEEPDFECGDGKYRVKIRANGVVVLDELGPVPVSIPVTEGT